MRRLVAFALGLAACSPALAASALDTLPDPATLFAHRDQVHALVLALEQSPLHPNAEKIRALLVVHYKEDVDYLVCGEVLGPLMDNNTLQPVAWQMVIASGDWVEAHPTQAKDIDAYTLAGLESGVRTYRALLALDPKAQSDRLDALAKEYDAHTLSDWNKAHPCRPA
jgi:phage tail protein X